MSVGALDGDPGVRVTLQEVRGVPTAQRFGPPAVARDAARLLRALRASATAAVVRHRGRRRPPAPGRVLRQREPGPRARRSTTPSSSAERRVATRECGLMYICHCRAVSDRTIRAEIELGAVDEDEIGDRCGAGTRCGSCVDEIRRSVPRGQARSAAHTRARRWVIVRVSASDRRARFAPCKVTPRSSSCSTRS